MNLEELYRSYSTDPSCKELLLQAHWFASFADFDPKTGEALPMSLSRALSRIANRERLPYVKDRLWLLMDHSMESAIRLMKALSEEPRRESAYLPIREVRELDTASFIALSRRPGRNIREKLADKPYMQAVRHYQSIDVPENRLLKTYLMRLADSLELRKKYLKDRSVDDFVQAIYRWLNQEEIQEIARWENLAPNNALISHRDYRRIWNSWRWLQSIEDDIERDYAHLDERRKTKARWEELARRYSSGNTVFADMPLDVDFNMFKIEPWDTSLPAFKTTGISHDKHAFETREPACIDLTQIQPAYATPTQSGVLEEAFIWQRWRDGRRSVDIELFDSDAIYAHQDAEIVASCDMFFSKSGASELLNQASRSFALRLREHFRNGRMIWHTPDCLNDFELELVRRNLNAGFSQAEPLPCSVAAVFEHIDYSMITHNGFRVAVVERINGKAILTEMVARFDADLAEELPETRGYIWEKGTSELFKDGIPADAVNAPFYVLKDDGAWTREYNPYGVSHTSSEDMVVEYEGYDLTIWLNGRPVRGGIKLYQLQRLVPGISLWRNHIPELMTKVMMDGFYQPFYFVGKDVTVKPVRGVAVRIDVPQEFTLPKGKRTYRLPLLQGANEEALEYEAKLVSRDFPYSEDVKCRLNMTYTYGADDPYRLVFEPLDRQYKPISVVWQLKEDVVIDDAPAPGYPAPATWADIQHHFSQKRNEYQDLTEWAIDASKKLFDILSTIDAKIISGRISGDWRRDKRGKRYTFVDNPSGNDYFIHESNLAHGVDADRLEMYDQVFFIVETWNGKVRANYVAPRENWAQDDLVYNVSQNATKYIYSAMYFPYLRIWAEGKSCTDTECPQAFRNSMRVYCAKICDFLFSGKGSDRLRDSLVFLLCCMGKDMPHSAASYVETLTMDRKADKRALGVALGDLSTPWQKRLFEHLLSQGNGFSLQVFAHAIWRYEGFIRAFSYADLVCILDFLENKLEKNCKKIISNPRSDQRKWDVIHTTRYLELLLGLLRTRESEDYDIRMLLQPGQEYTQNLAKQVNLLIANAIEQGDTYFSRVQFDVSSKPSDDRTPDLLYVLRVYLEGDTAANAIRVTGIVDDDDEDEEGR